MQLTAPTNSQVNVTSEKERWETIFQREDFFYGHEPGPVARRAVKYHKALAAQRSEIAANALDAGCGEGQDLVYLAQNGYKATGIEFTPSGVEKTRKLLQLNQQKAEVAEGNLADCLLQIYDLVLAVNSLQFMGEQAATTLSRLQNAVSHGGIIGLSLFAREAHQPEISGTIWRVTLPDLLARFENWQIIEAANLWQWNLQTNEAQAFVTLIAQRPKEKL